MPDDSIVRHLGELPFLLGLALLIILQGMRFAKDVVDRQRDRQERRMLPDVQAMADMAKVFRDAQMDGHQALMDAVTDLRAAMREQVRAMTALHQQLLVHERGEEEIMRQVAEDMGRLARVIDRMETRERLGP